MCWRFILIGLSRMESLLKTKGISLGSSHLPISNRCKEGISSQKSVLHHVFRVSLRWANPPSPGFPHQELVNWCPEGTDLRVEAQASYIIYFHFYTQKGLPGKGNSGHWSLQPLRVTTIWSPVWVSPYSLVFPQKSVFQFHRQWGSCFLSS